MLRNTLHNFVSLLENCSNLKFLKQVHAFALINTTHNPSLWVTIIKKYVHLGQLEQALLLYSKTRRPIQRPIQFVIPLVLKSCVSLFFFPHGRIIHAEIFKTGFQSNVFIATSLIDMYAKGGDLSLAHQLFDETPERNVITWNAMIGGYSRIGDMESASSLFYRMPARTSVSWTEMIDGFSRIGNTCMARQLFDQMPEKKSVVTWTVMIDGYAKNGEMESARQMLEDMPDRNFFVWTSMIDGYFKKGDIKEARAIFDQIPIRNLVNWNALIAGYAQNGFSEEALEAFRQMRLAGFEPDQVTVTSVLSASAQLGSLDSGKEIHKLIDRMEISLNQFVLNGLIDMYAKCGDLERARQLFNELPERNSVCWNSMIAGLAIHGRSQEALDLFTQMEISKEKPNEVTFLAVLSACSHGGFVKEGLEIFTAMSEKYGLDAGVEHYGCLVDLLGRAGKLNEAYDLIKKMPMKPNDAVWGALLGACRTHMDMGLAERVVGEAGLPDSGKKVAACDDNGHFVLLSNIYASADRWEKAEKMRKTMVENGVQKTPGCSAIMVGSSKHQFLAGSHADSRTCQLYAAI